MQAILVFDFDDKDRDDKQEFELHMKACAMYSVIWDFKQYLRNEEKYKELPKAEDDYLEKITNKFYELLNENEIGELMI
uniref:Uncharacterized protein n=1 Tax=viral metagenome TaxID=1070528 RepID=A0A6M3KNE8_9ZZZZ